jgi:hypothetical protein
MWAQEHKHKDKHKQEHGLEPWFGVRLQVPGSRQALVALAMALMTSLGNAQTANGLACSLCLSHAADGSRSCCMPRLMSVTYLVQ